MRLVGFPRVDASATSRLTTSNCAVATSTPSWLAVSVNGLGLVVRSGTIGARSVVESHDPAASAVPKAKSWSVLTV